MISFECTPNPQRILYYQGDDVPVQTNDSQIAGGIHYYLDPNVTHISEPLAFSRPSSVAGLAAIDGSATADSKIVLDLCQCGKTWSCHGTREPFDTASARYDVFNRDPLAIWVTVSDIASRLTTGRSVGCRKGRLGART